MSAVFLALGLLLCGSAVLVWRPWSELDGARPRLVIALIVTAAAAVWVGSLGLLILGVSGERTGFLRACEALWSKLVTGQLSWWQWTIAGLWLGAFPGQALAATTVSLRQTHGVCRLLRAVASPLPGSCRRLAVLVPDLATPALTVGILRPQVFIDESFWERCSTHERRVLLAHEHAHRRGRHAMVDLAARALLRPLRPLAISTTACEAMRAHLEAMADDAAARCYGRESVGRTLGFLALAEAPAVGLGMTGSSVWRVQRLPAAGHQDRFHALSRLVPVLALLLAGLALTTAQFVELVSTACYCLL